MCPECEARRELVRKAWLQANGAAVVKNIAKGAAELVGAKAKTGMADLAADNNQPRKSSAKTGKSAS